MTDKHLKTEKIMRQIATWEKERLFKKALWFIPLVGIALTITISTGNQVISEANALGLSDLVTALTDDFEGFLDQFVQNFMLIWEFISKDTFFVSSLTALLFVVILFLTRREMTSFPKRISSIRKYLSGKGGDHK